MVWPIPVINILYPRVKAHRLAIRSSRHIAENQRVIGDRLLGFKLSEQHIEEAANISLIRRARMMRNKTRQTPISSLIP
jgi:hypothetical protein